MCHAKAPNFSALTALLFRPGQLQKTPLSKIKNSSFCFSDLGRSKRPSFKKKKKKKPFLLFRMNLNLEAVFTWKWLNDLQLNYKNCQLVFCVCVCFFFFFFFFFLHFVEVWIKRKNRACAHFNIQCARRLFHSYLDEIKKKVKIQVLNKYNS